MLLVRKNQVVSQDYYVCEYTPKGEFRGTVAGLGRNKGTWDTSLRSRRTAQRHAATLRAKYPESRFSVETLD